MPDQEKRLYILVVMNSILHYLTASPVPSFSSPSFRLLQSSNVSCHLLSPPIHLSHTRLQVLPLIISSTILSLRTNPANASVLASLGIYREPYGSSLASIVLSLAVADSTSRSIFSGSEGSGDVATEAQ